MTWVVSNKLLMPQLLLDDARSNVGKVLMRTGAVSSGVHILLTRSSSSLHHGHIELVVIKV
jgi:hypothetical protein